MLNRFLLYIIVFSTFSSIVKGQTLNPKDDESLGIGLSAYGGTNLIYGDLLGFRLGYYGGVALDKEFLKVLGVQARYTYGTYNSVRTIKNKGNLIESSGKYSFISVGPKLNVIPILEPGSELARYKVFFHFLATYINYTPSIVWGKAASQKGDLITGYPDLSHTDNLNKGRAFAYTYGMETRFLLGNGISIFSNFDVHPTNSDRLDGYTNNQLTNPLYKYDPEIKKIVKREFPLVTQSERKLSKTNDILVSFDIGVRYLIPYKTVSRNRTIQVNKRSSFKFLPSNKRNFKGGAAPSVKKKLKKR